VTCRALPKPLADFFAYTAKKEARRHLACAAPRVTQSLSNRTHDHGRSSDFAKVESNTKQLLKSVYSKRAFIASAVQYAEQ